MTDPTDMTPLSARADALLANHQQQIYRRIDRLFAVLMPLQWLAAVCGAFWITPEPLSGEPGSIFPHVWLAILLGGLLCSVPVTMAWIAPGRALTRYSIACAQVLFSSLLIHIGGGRIEMHYHVFLSLAFLAAYRDWKLLIPPAILVVADHFVRGAFWPETVFGGLPASPWRWLEHSVWVIFEDVFLIITIELTAKEMRAAALQAAELESNHAELRHSNEHGENANSAKSEFLANINREIRAPLNGVLGVADGKRGRFGPAEQRNHRSKIDVAPVEYERAVRPVETSFREAARPEANRHIPPATQNALPPIRVLLVDDGEANRELLSLALADAGASVKCAENGRVAIELARRGRFDLILMDMQMPVMDGFTAARTLRSLGFGVPILALTTHTTQEDIDRCLAAGCSGYLSKPVQIDPMLAAIRAALEGSDDLSPATERQPGDAAGGSIHAAAGEQGGGAATGQDDPTAHRPGASFVPDAERAPIFATLPINLPQFQRIVDDFIAKLGVKMEEMHALHEAGDCEALARLAHWLKGSGGTVGFDCLTKPSAELEQFAKQGDTSGARRALNELGALADRIIPVTAD